VGSCRPGVVIKDTTRRSSIQRPPRYFTRLILLYCSHLQRQPPRYVQVQQNMQAQQASQSPPPTLTIQPFSALCNTASLEQAGRTNWRGTSPSPQGTFFIWAVCMGHPFILHTILAWCSLYAACRITNGVHIHIAISLVSRLRASLGRNERELFSLLFFATVSRRGHGSHSYLWHIRLPMS
jgi:hypothetical protein